MASENSRQSMLFHYFCKDYGLSYVNMAIEQKYSRTRVPPVEGLSCLPAIWVSYSLKTAARIMRDSSMAECRAHNPKVEGSTPSPAKNAPAPKRGKSIPPVMGMKLARFHRHGDEG